MQARERGRPRKIDDAALLAAFQRVHLRMNPTSWTLADVARNAGVVPATLIQRFGSKLGLMQAALVHGAAAIDTMALRALETNDSPLAALTEYVAALICDIESPEMMANSIAQLHVELSQETLRPLVRAYTERIAAGFRVLIAAAIQDGCLAGGDPEAIAASVYDVYSGGIVTYAIAGEGPITDWVNAAIARILAPWLPHRAP